MEFEWLDRIDKTELKVGHYYQTVIHKIKVLSLCKIHTDDLVETWYFVKRTGQYGRGECRKPKCPFMKTKLVQKYKCDADSSPYMCGTIEQIGYHREMNKLRGLLEVGV